MKKTGSIVIVILIIGFILAGFSYISYRSNNAISDAAFVKSDNLLFLSFKVGGKVVTLTKKEGEMIKKGEILAQIDPKDFLIQKDKISHEIDSLIAKKEALIIKQKQTKEELEVQILLLNNKKAKLTPTIASLEYNIDGLKAQQEKLTKDKQRFTTLYNQKLIQKEKLEAIDTKLKGLNNKIASLNSKLMALKLDYKDIQYNIKLINIKQQSISELKQNIISLDKKIKSLNDSKKAIQNQLNYTTLYSPIDAIVAKRFITTQRVVQKGSLIYSIVSPENLHIEVLLSEKKLHGIEKGSKVKIDIDAIDNRSFKGEVESILPASAATFSLVPRDIASGEFTKLDQRFIVRISILNPTKKLKVGMGATVAIKRD